MAKHASEPKPDMQMAVVGALVSPDGLIVLVKDVRGFNVPHWKLPGGHVKKDEKVLEAFARECEEECGITLPSGKGLKDRVIARTAEHHSDHSRFFLVLAAPEVDTLYGDRTHRVMRTQDPEGAQHQVICIPLADLERYDILPAHERLIRSLAAQRAES